MIRKFVFILVFVFGFVPSAFASPEKYCFEVYGRAKSGSDAGVYLFTYVDGKDPQISKKTADEPFWVKETVNFGGFAFVSNNIYQAIAAGTQYRSLIYGPLEAVPNEKWLLIESLDGNYQYQTRWDSGVPFAADWSNNKLVIASTYGMDSVKIQVFTVAGENSHLTPTVVEFVYTKEPLVVKSIHWVTCT